MKPKFIIAHMQAAYIYANLSYCNRRKVGCVITKGTNIIAYGYNGTPAGWDNACEDENNVTFPHVYHAEVNAINKLAQTSGGGIGSSVFITCSPCFQCATHLANLEIKELFYGEHYHCTDGIELLRQHEIPVEQINIKEFFKD